VKKTRYVLLGLLQEEELSGYEMKKAIDIRMSFFWQESFG
jgi:DNA-binding PadR family transcriptional regulator